MMLRKYQIEDINKTKAMNRCALFNEPRTGKTPTAITWAKVRNCNKLIVVCPASAIPGWKTELNNWYPTIEVYTCMGSRAAKLIAVTAYISTPQNVALVLSYDTLKSTKNREGYVDRLLKSKTQCIIIDEAHRLRGRTTATALSVFRLTRRVPNAIALTGTPAYGKPEDIYSIMHMLFPTKYTSYWKFVDEWCNTFTMPNKYGRDFTNVTGIKKSKQKELTKILQEFSTIRKREDIMPWLPESFHVQVKLQPTKKQIHYLTELKKWYKVDDVLVKGELDRLIRYRQICDSPELLNLDTASPKLDWIKQYVEDYPEESIIIFSNFTQFLKIIHEAIPASELLIGATPIKRRGELCKKFQAGEFKIFLINTMAGQEALTLDKAETTIFTDKYPPVGMIDQAEARFLATTEERAHKNHKIVELMMKDTYDEVIYTMLRNRASAVDIINNYNKYTGKDD